MALQVYIDDTLVDGDNIVEWPASNEAISFEGEFTVPEEFSLTLDNTDPTVYDDRYAGSMFYGGAKMRTLLKVYDDEVDRFIFSGKIYNISTDDGSKQIIVDAASMIADLSDKPCTYTNTTDKTPADIIYEILTGAANGNIDPDSIVKAGFDHASQVQTANSAFVDVTFGSDATSTSDTSCIAVINELLRISHCHIYTSQSLIYMWQYEAYAGAIGAAIYDHDVVAKSYKQSYSIETPYKMFNSYEVGYDSGATVAWLTGSDSTSVLAYGEKKYMIPADGMETDDPSAFNILYRNVTGATWAGATAIARYKNLMKLCEFSTGDGLSYIKVGDQVDLRFGPFNGDPCLVLEREYDRTSRTIKFICLFLNTPVEIYSRDVTPPDAPELVAVIPIYGGVVLKWTKDLAADHAGYRIYFSSTPGEWYSEECHKGRSPIDNKSTALSEDGYIYQTLVQLNQGTVYYFKVTAYDTSYNESEYSNTIDAATCLTAENSESCNGNIAFNVTLDSTNQREGVVPDDCLTYADDHYYGSDNYTATAYFESGILRYPAGFYGAEWFAYGNSGDIKFQYRTALTQAGIASASWSTEIDATAYNSQLFNSTNPYMQYRFVFYSPNWSDADAVYIKNIVGN